MIRVYTVCQVSSHFACFPFNLIPFHLFPFCLLSHFVYSHFVYSCWLYGNIYMVQMEVHKARMDIFAMKNKCCPHGIVIFPGQPGKFWLSGQARKVSLQSTKIIFNSLSRQNGSRRKWTVDAFAFLHWIQMHWYRISQAACRIPSFAYGFYL